jgi:hypothetical protein
MEPATSHHSADEMLSSAPRSNKMIEDKPNCRAYNRRRKADHPIDEQVKSGVNK